MITKSFPISGPKKEEVKKISILKKALRMAQSLKLEEPHFYVKYLILHHSLTEDTKLDNYNAIKKYHINKNGWSDIGYHFVINKTLCGMKIQKGRKINVIGAHVKGLNHESLGICTVGNYDIESPKMESWIYTKALFYHLMNFFKVQNKNIIGHSEAQRLLGIPIDKRKSCPGKAWSMWQFRKELSTLKKEII